MTDHITIASAIRLATIIEAAQGTKRVAWLDDSNQVCRGTARHIVGNPETFGFLERDANVFDGWLRVTTDSGFELAQPISEIVPKVGERWFVTND